jgi:hypothetical protein
LDWTGFETTDVFFSDRFFKIFLLSQGFEARLNKHRTADATPGTIAFLSWVTDRTAPWDERESGAVLRGLGQLGRQGVNGQFLAALATLTEQERNAALQEMADIRDGMVQSLIAELEAAPRPELRYGRLDLTGLAQLSQLLAQDMTGALGADGAAQYTAALTTAIEERAAMVPGLVDDALSQIETGGDNLNAAIAPLQALLGGVDIPALPAAIRTEAIATIRYTDDRRRDRGHG